MEFEDDVAPEIKAQMLRKALAEKGDQMDVDTRSSFLIQALSAEGQSASDKARAQREAKEKGDKSRG